MIQLNLLPDVKKEYLQSQKSKATVISASIVVTIAAAGVGVLLFAYVTFVQQIQVGIIDGDIKKRTSDLNATEDLSKYLTIQNQLKALPQLHAQKPVYSRLFQFLPTLNPSSPNSVKLSVLQVTSQDKSIVLTGNTATFESLKVFADTLSNAQVTSKDESGDQTDKMFESVAVQNSSIARANNATTVAFTIRAVYKDSVFDPAANVTGVQVPNIQTTQSVTGSPKTLFEGTKQGGQ